MKRKLLSLVLVAIMALSLVACGSTEDNNGSETSNETKAVTDLVIGELHYSVVEDGGWAQAMHEGLVTACNNLGIDTETQLLTRENISEEDIALVESTIEELVDNGADVIFGCSAGYATIFADIDLLNIILALVTTIVEGFALI